MPVSTDVAMTWILERMNESKIDDGAGGGRDSARVVDREESVAPTSLEGIRAHQQLRQMASSTGPLGGNAEVLGASAASDELTQGLGMGIGVGTRMGSGVGMGMGPPNGVPVLSSFHSSASATGIPFSNDVYCNQTAFVPPLGTAGTQGILGCAVPLPYPAIVPNDDSAYKISMEKKEEVRMRYTWQ